MEEIKTKNFFDEENDYEVEDEDELNNKQVTFYLFI